MLCWPNSWIPTKLPLPTTNEHCIIKGELKQKKLSTYGHEQASYQTLTFVCPAVAADLNKIVQQFSNYVCKPTIRL